MKNLKTIKEKQISTAKDDVIWVNPVGGLGDTLMLSGVLKLAYDKNPQKKYNLVRRTKYLSILENHPAIAEVGFPPEGSKIISSAYWAIEKLGAGNQRAFQILARNFGLKTPVEETLYLPNINAIDDSQLINFIPWKKKNILIAPISDSPRKCLHPMGWHILTDKFLSQGYLVLQAGRMWDVHIKGAYSLLGLTSPRQLINLIARCDLVVTVDNFIMHAAHLHQKPCIVLWGPTKAEVYGYKEQQHIAANLSHCPHKNACLGPEFADNYAKPCPLNEQHCMNTISIDYIYETAQNLL